MTERAFTAIIPQISVSKGSKMDIPYMLFYSAIGLLFGAAGVIIMNIRLHRGIKGALRMGTLAFALCYGAFAKVALEVLATAENTTRAEVVPVETDLLIGAAVLFLAVVTAWALRSYLKH